MKNFLKKFNVELYVASVVLYCVFIAVIGVYYPTTTVRALTTGSSVMYFVITFIIMLNHVAKKEKREFNN